MVWGGGGGVWRRVGSPEDVTLGPSPVSRGDSHSVTVAGAEGGVVTSGWGGHARVHGQSAPCPNILPRWPFLV